jgi:hypothetical protein
MGIEENLKTSFAKVKEDVEGVKDELAFAMKRISHMETMLNRKAIQEVSKGKSRFRKKKGKKR